MKAVIAYWFKPLSAGNRGIESRALYSDFLELCASQETNLTCNVVKKKLNLALGQGTPSLMGYGQPPLILNGDQSLAVDVKRWI